MSEPKVFVSYPHVHADLVSSLVSLLRGCQRLVFQDSSSLTPGDKWEAVLIEALKDASIVVVLWCKHAVGSVWVMREIDTALETAKRVIPVILDDTPLQEKLSAFQYIDFRRWASHDSFPMPPMGPQLRWPTPSPQNKLCELVMSAIDGPVE